MTIREAANGVVLPMGATYRIGFNGNDQTELDASNLDDLEKLWRSLCVEFKITENDVDYVELVDVWEKAATSIKDCRANRVKFSSLKIGEAFVEYCNYKPHYFMKIYPIRTGSDEYFNVINLANGRCFGWYEDDVVDRVDLTLVVE